MARHASKIVRLLHYVAFRPLELNRCSVPISEKCQPDCQLLLKSSPSGNAGLNPIATCYAVCWHSAYCMGQQAEVLLLFGLNWHCYCRSLGWINDVTVATCHWHQCHHCCDHACQASRLYSLILFIIFKVLLAILFRPSLLSSKCLQISIHRRYLSNALVVCGLINWDHCANNCYSN